MDYYIVNKKTGIAHCTPGSYSKRYSTYAAARAAQSKLGFKSTHKVVCAADYAVPMKTVKNLMSGKELTIPADTPLCCDPSSETYWSM